MGVSGLGVQVSAWEPPSRNGVAVGSGRNPRSNGREYNFTISDFSIQKIARFIGVSSNRIVIFGFWGLFVFCIQIFCKTYGMISYASVMGNNLTHNPSLGAQLLRMFVSQDVMHSRWRCAIRKMTMCMITPNYLNRRCSKSYSTRWTENYICTARMYTKSGVTKPLELTWPEFEFWICNRCDHRIWNSTPWSLKNRHYFGIIFGRGFWRRKGISLVRWWFSRAQNQRWGGIYG